MPIDCTSGTEFPTSVAMARANRLVSALRSASPRIGIRNRISSHQRRPGVVPIYMRNPATATVSAAAATHHQSCTTLLRSSMIFVGTGIFIRPSSNTLAKRGTTNSSNTKTDPTPTIASRPG